MPFLWKKLILAPLVAPLLFAALFTGTMPLAKWLFSFAFFFSIASVISYGTTVLLFVPALFCLSRFITLRFTLVALLGFFLGILVFFPLTYQAWLSSGPDSGPPVGSYWQWMRTSWTDVTSWSFPVSGIITATAFWLIGRGRPALHENTLKPA